MSEWCFIGGPSDDRRRASASSAARMASMGVMEAGTDRPRGDSEELGDLGRLVANEVAEDQDRPLVRREPPEAAIELVSIRRRQELVRRGRVVDREHVQVRDPLALPTGFGDADVGEEPVDPGVEPVRIAEARQVTPGDHQRVLQGILGPVDVTQDPMRDREEAAAAKANQVDECRLIASLRRHDEIAIHRLSLGGARRGRRPLVSVDPAPPALEISRPPQIALEAASRHLGATP